jgi:hypothetical protein
VFGRGHGAELWKKQADNRRAVMKTLERCGSIAPDQGLRVQRFLITGIVKNDSDEANLAAVWLFCCMCLHYAERSSWPNVPLG